MAQTTSANVFVPEVYQDTAQASFTGAVRVAGSAAVLEDNTLVGQGGDTVTFPKWGTLSELADLTEGTAITPEAMSNTDMSATIKEVGAGVEITDKARLVSLGDPEAEAARQFGVLFARKVDADLITEAQNTTTTSPLQVSYNGDAAATVQQELTWNAIVAGIAAFGDEWAPEDFAGIFINSAQHAQVLRDANFISADKLGQSGTPIATGQVGAIGGVPLFVTDRVAANKVLLVKRGALGLLYKQRAQVESDRDILARANVITTTAHYAVKRLNDRGVCVLTLTVGA